MNWPEEDGLEGSQDAGTFMEFIFKVRNIEGCRCSYLSTSQSKKREIKSTTTNRENVTF